MMLFMMSLLLLFGRPAVRPASVPLTAGSIHKQKPSPVSTPTNPPRSLLSKSVIVLPFLFVTWGPRVIVPVPRSRVRDFSGLLYRAKTLPDCVCALVAAPHRARAAPASNRDFLGTIMFTFLRDALFSERMFDRVKTPRCARRVAFTVGGTGTVPRPGVRGEASSQDSWT